MKKTLASHQSFYNHYSNLYIVGSQADSMSPNKFGPGQQHFMLIFDNGVVMGIICTTAQLAQIRRTQLGKAIISAS